MVTGTPVAAARRTAADDLPDLAPPVMSWILDAVSDPWCLADDALSELEGLGSWTPAGGFDEKCGLVILMAAGRDRLRQVAQKISVR